MPSVVLSTFIVLSLLSASCGGSSAVPASDVISVSDAWSRQPAEGQVVGVAYATVSNRGESDVRIVSASSTASGDVQLHETLMDDAGAMSMQEVEDFTIPAGESFAFEPGGPHIMMMGIDAATFPAETVDVTVTFADGTSVAFDAEVRSIGGDGMEGMEDMDGMEDMEGMQDTVDGDHSHGTDSIDASELHAVDDELAEGIFEPARQMEVVQTYVTFFANAADGSAEAEALASLENLMVQLQSGNVETAAAAAAEAHDFVHSLEDHG